MANGKGRSPFECLRYIVENRRAKMKNKNLANLALLLLVFVAIGCSCPSLKDLASRGDTSNAAPSASPLVVPTISNSKVDSDISIAKFKQIKVGAKRADVEVLLGGKGTELSSSEAGKTTLSTNKWTGEGYTSIILIFKNDKVFSKSQVGLK